LARHPAFIVVIMKTRVLSILLATLLAGCGQKSGPDLASEVQRLSTELEATRTRLAAAETLAATKTDEAAKAAADTFVAELNKKPTPDQEKAAAEKDTQIKALQAEIASLKKQDVALLTEATGYQQRGLTTIAIDRYNQFVRDHPNSPLMLHADRALLELKVTADKESKERQKLIDPKMPQRDVLKRWEDGAVTIEEMGPLLKNRKGPEIVNLLGKPNQVYRNGSELAYTDKVIDTTTGNKETLVIVLDGSGYATSFRLGYRGREIKP